MSKKIQESIKLIRRALLDWYGLHQRDLPWRRTKDPYAIWLSEIMLQQTTVETVVPYYNHFLKKYPTLEAMALASEAELLKAWSGLGYYNRIRQFKKACDLVLQEKHGRIPDCREDLLKLPGIGDYTSAAIASIAFGKPHAVVDGNVVRVLARLLAHGGDTGTVRTKKIISERATELLDRQHPGDFNQAMMELGATVCVPKNPRCPVCPLARWCCALASGRQAELPVKSKKIIYQDEDSVGLLCYQKDRLLLRCRQRGEIMAGLWEVPSLVFKASVSQALKTLQLQLALKNHDQSKLTAFKPVKHAIMNRRMKIFPFLLHVAASRQRRTDFFSWVTPKQLDKIPLTTVTKKLLKLTPTLSTSFVDK